jgi:leucyl/phenylalanyl-tRNA--protein transferase
VAALRQGGGTLLDVQWATDHLRTLGVVEISRVEYHRRLSGAVDQPQLQLVSPAGSLLAP